VEFVVPFFNTQSSILLEGYTDASIKYGIRTHQYDRIKYSFIETDLIFSLAQLFRTLRRLALICLWSAHLGFSFACMSIFFSYLFLRVMAQLFFTIGSDFFLIALDRGLKLFIPWLLSTPGLYFFAGAVVIVSVAFLCAIFIKDSNLRYDLYAAPACLYHIAIFPFVTAFNFLSLVNNTVYSSAYYLTSCFDTRPAPECLDEYLNEHFEIKHICLDLKLENTLDLKQLRNLMDSIPPSVKKIELRTPFGQSYSEEAYTVLFKALNSVNREKIMFNRPELTDKWESWQNAHTFYTLEQTSVPSGRPRLNQDVIRFGIFSYLEPSGMPAMFDGLCP
jgi:hypothetical protein